VKWYGVLGNHDYHGNIDAQVDRSSTSGETMWYMADNYYYIDYKVYGGAILTIVYIDTCLLDPYVKDTENILTDPNWVDDRMKHLEWIEQTLLDASTRSNWVLVAGHYPIYSIGEHGDDQFLIDDLLPLLLKYKVHAYLAGHDHSHQHIYKDGLHHIISGLPSPVPCPPSLSPSPFPASGNTAGRGPFGKDGYQYLGLSEGSPYVKNWFLDCGFGVVSVHATQLNFTFIDNHGKVHYRTTLENVKNKDLISGVVLKGLGISPQAAGLVIFVPTLILVVGIIGFLSKDFWSTVSSDIHDQETLHRSGSMPSSFPSSRRHDIESATGRKGDMDDSAKWSDIDVSTDRLAPSRHGG
jgi:hypothetical protein